jgi:hypothetical protein
MPTSNCNAHRTLPGGPERLSARQPPAVQARFPAVYVKHDRRLQAAAALRRANSRRRGSRPIEGVAVKSDDVKLRNRVIRGKTAPGSQEAREQYKQLRFMMNAQWVFAAFMAVVVVYYSLSWLFLAVLAVCCAFGIPAQRKILRLVRENAYPHGSPNE